MNQSSNPSSHPVWALILAGGAGTRFWPASRVALPKQLLPLAGENPLIVDTALRVLPLCATWDRVIVATGKHLVTRTKESLPELPRGGLLIEPAARNTAPCIGWAAARIARTDPEGIVMVLPSDHHIADPEGFRSVLSAAIAEASRGYVTTIGIKPTHPETGYGYIELPEQPILGRAMKATRFVEKPDRARAEAFVESGRYLWNAGMFIFRAKDMLEGIRKHLPELAEGLDRIDRAATKGHEAEEVERLFPTLPAVSIDFGVMERLESISVVPGSFGWSDLGSWQSAWELGKKDALGNSTPDGAVMVDAKNNHVVDLRSDRNEKKRVISLVGVSDLVVVETDDALLVVPRARAQDVKEVVEKLRARNDHDRT